MVLNADEVEWTEIGSGRYTYLARLGLGLRLKVKSSSQLAAIRRVVETVESAGLEMPEKWVLVFTYHRAPVDYWVVKNGELVP